MEKGLTIATARTVLEVPGPEDAQLMLDYYRINQQHLAPWEPLWPEDFLTREHWRARQHWSRESFGQGTAFKFAALKPDRSEIVAVCNFTNVVHGPFLACTLGFSIAAKYRGQGIMREVLEAGIEYIFKSVRLHRVMAAYVPANYRSAALLARLGFVREGYARNYLQIAGRWRDHVLVAKTNHSVAPRQPARHSSTLPNPQTPASKTTSP